MGIIVFPLLRILLGKNLKNKNKMLYAQKYLKYHTYISQKKNTKSGPKGWKGKYGRKIKPKNTFRTLERNRRVAALRYQEITNSSLL